jgi:hypothetical protein
MANSNDLDKFVSVNTKIDFPLREAASFSVLESDDHYLLEEDAPYLQKRRLSF